MLVCVTLCAAPAAAQSPGPSTEGPTEAQRAEIVELNRSGVSALQRGEYERAVRLFEEALQVAPLNVTYLNLGRTYQEWGKCAEAREAYDAVPGAPAADQPPRDAVLEAVYEFRLELDEACADEEPDETVVETTPIERPEADEPMSLRPLAIITGGAGVALLGTATAIELFVLPRQYDQERAAGFDTTRSVNRGLYIGGGALVAAGVALWIADSARPAHALRPVIGADRVGFAWEVRW